MTLLLWKILFLIVLFMMSLSLATWALKNRPAWVRKPLVILLFIPTYAPRVLIGLLNGDAYTRWFWKELKSNLRIAWKGHT